MADDRCPPRPGTTPLLARARRRSYLPTDPRSAHGARGDRSHGSRLAIPRLMLTPLLLQLAQIAFPIVPAPAHLVPGEGTFAVSARTVVAVSDPANVELRALRDLLARNLAQAFGVVAIIVVPPTLLAALAVTYGRATGAHRATSGPPGP